MLEIDNVGPAETLFWTTVPSFKYDFTSDENICLHPYAQKCEEGEGGERKYSWTYSKTTNKCYRLYGAVCSQTTKNHFEKERECLMTCRANIPNADR